MINKNVALVLLCCTIVISGRAQTNNKKNKSLSVFSIGKRSVSAEEFIHLYRKNHQERKPGEYTKEKIEEYLDLFIKFKLKVEEALHRGLDTTASFRKEYKTYREELRKPYLPDSRLTDSLVQLTYARLKEEVKASHILINVSADASPDDTLKAYNKILDLRTAILNGKDFGTVAASYSEDPTAKVNQGNLGYFTAMQMVFPFEQAAYTTKVNDISMPIRTSFGYHIIKVTDRKPARGEVEVSHILIRTGDGSDHNQAKNTVFDVYDQLQKGVKWEELCKEYSQDASTKENGGRLRPFGVGTMSAIPSFEHMAFNLQKPGDYSDPFQTQFGWHIIRLESKIPVPAFEDLAVSLKNRVNRDERSQISKLALQLKVRKEFGFTENNMIKNRLMTLADTTLSNGKWRPNPDATTINSTLFLMNGKTYPLKDFVTYAQRNQKPNSLSPEKYLAQLYDQYVDDILSGLQEDKIKQKNPDYTWLLKEYYEGILLFEIMEKEVWNRATEDSIGQQKYFQAHTSDYKAGERIKGKIFSSGSKNIVDQLKALVESGDSVKIQTYIAAEKIRQETGAFEKADRPVLAKINWSPGVHTSENNGTYYVVWIKKILPPGLKTFNEARSAVISDYQNFVEAKWLEQLKKEYPVKINKKGKQYTLQQLVKN